MAVASKTFPKIKARPYALVRPQIRSGDILLCSGSRMFSKMIQKATNSVWSHVAFVLRLPSIDRSVIEKHIDRLTIAPAAAQEA